MTIKNGNFYVVQAFMVNDLSLKGVELGLYAILYGFSQNGQPFRGSVRYLAEWLGVSRRTVYYHLANLQKRGLLLKTEGGYRCASFGTERATFAKRRANFAQDNIDYLSYNSIGTEKREDIKRKRGPATQKAPPSFQPEEFFALAVKKVQKEWDCLEKKNRNRP